MPWTLPCKAYTPIRPFAIDLSQSLARAFLKIILLLVQQKRCTADIQTKFVMEPAEVVGQDYQEPSLSPAICERQLTVGPSTENTSRFCPMTKALKTRTAGIGFMPNLLFTHRLQFTRLDHDHVVNS